MKSTHRSLVKLRNTKTGVVRYADSFAFWEDLGNGVLQPTESRQTQPIITPENMKVGQGWNGYVLACDQYHYMNTSMNNHSFR